jgi:hypothetical protein
MHAYIDESGDTGNSEKSTKYFILTAFIIQDLHIKNLEKDISKYLVKLVKVNKKRLHYFHAYKERDKTKKDLLNIIHKYDCKIVYRIFDKSRNTSKINYSDALGLFIKNLNSEIKDISVSRYDTRKSILELIKNNNQGVDIEFKANSSNFLLQVADLFSWIIFQNYEKYKNEYFEMCKNIEKQNP